MNADASSIHTDIAVVGGGVSGALTAYHLVRRAKNVRVAVIDPREEIGLGLAYSTPSRQHLLNVPAGKISALPDDPDHFLQWLKTRYEPTATADTFAPRAIFGRYIQSLLAEVDGIEHVRASATDCKIETSADDRLSTAVLTLDDGRIVRAERVVLAMGNFDPAPLPGIDPATIADGRYRHNAWSDDAYENLATDAPVTLIGTGLTAVDVLLRLRENGHRGIVTAISRHAVFPHRHQPHPTLHTAVIPSETPATCSGYVRTIRRSIDAGVDWRSAVDSLRATTNDLWLRLSHDEQRRFKRHLQRRWDVLRHRMAPPIADALERERLNQTMVQRHGHLVSVTSAERTDEYANALVTIQTRRGTQKFEARRVINCTGPNMNYRRVGSTLLNRLFDDGMISAGPHGTGLRCDENGAVIDGSGKPSDVMFNIGPGRLGTLLESIAVPELRQQAFELAELLVAHRSLPTHPVSERA